MIKNKTEITRPAFKWAGGKASSGIAPHIVRIYQDAKPYMDGSYVVPFAGALGDVYKVMPDHFVAIDVEPIVVLTNAAIADGQKLWPTGVLGRSDYYDVRTSFNILKRSYLDIPLENRPKEYFDTWDLPDQLLLPKYEDDFDGLKEDVAYVAVIKLLTSQEIFDAIQEESDSDSEEALSDNAKLIKYMRTDAERQLFTLFIWLNKNCFNGLYRVNRQGNNNVPIGSRKHTFNPVQGYIDRHSEFLSKGDLYCDDFRNIREYLKQPSGNIIYLDPPYASDRKSIRNGKNNFSAYNANKFGIDEHIELARLAAELVDEGNVVIASNSDNQEICDLYAEHGFHVRFVEARRRLSSKGNERDNVMEMLSLGVPESINTSLGLFSTFFSLRESCEYAKSEAA